MNKIKRFFIIISSLYCAVSIHAQDYSVSLSGTYRFDSQSEGGFYDAFVFDGAGKVQIHAFMRSKGDFFQIGDTIIIYPEKDALVFLKKDDQTLVGITTWIEDHVFKKMENDTVIPPSQHRSENYAALFYEYYTLVGKESPELSILNIRMDTSYHTLMKKLCEKGFPKACITMANASMLSGSLLSLLIQDSPNGDQEIPIDKDVVEYFTKAIELNEPDAVVQLGAYLRLIGHEEEATLIFEKGCELGYRECCLSLTGFQLEWDE